MAYPHFLYWNSLGGEVEIGPTCVAPAGGDGDFKVVAGCGVIILEAAPWSITVCFEWVCELLAWSSEIFLKYILGGTVNTRFWLMFAVKM